MKVRVEAHLTLQEAAKLNKIAKSKKRSRKNLAELILTDYIKAHAV